jgi:hypothetical protein
MKFLAKFIDILSWAVGFLLFSRIIFRLLGANSSAEFIIWLYSFTDSLILPFSGIFPSPNFGTFVLDISAV